MGQLLQFPIMAKHRNIEDLPNRLRYWRKRRGHTLQSLAAETGCTFAHIARMETGERELTEAWMDRFAAVLDILPADLHLPEKGGLTEVEREMIATYREVPEALRGGFTALMESHRPFRGAPEIIPLAPHAPPPSRKRA